MIVGRNEPLYEIDLDPPTADASSSASDLNPYILHSSLDMLEMVQWTQHGT